MTTKDVKPENYSCEVLLERTTEEKSHDTKFPTDAYNVIYSYEGNECLDVTRSCKMANIFDLYYDRYGKGLKSTTHGHGTISPTRYGYKAPPKKKKRR